MVTLHTTNGKRWYWHATERDLLKAMSTPQYPFIGVSATDDGPITWHVATAHITNYRVEDDE